MFNNSTLSTTAITIQPKRDYYVTNPFDSWYVGGILFMCTVMFVLLYANYYRENACHNCWMRVLGKFGLTQPLPVYSHRSSLNHINNAVVV
ncbi:unnamed protein product [Adineta steineri]|uniref:Uncharacterized protein n=1 Tax=Adineta steineri TaxID=433720 RepID=A0A814SRI9_9BILA|nr:unnamed protein product [Adineta steineri]CAF1128768.1 unnamed protein product [Adineta steineri]CAF1150020.1 unnamed protein product [Adineta steineri]CAF3719147.1 unnamed protein product [Adineta steineri]CAF3938072.1 unnamed protein product [Adineta steineri]